MTYNNDSFNGNITKAHEQPADKSLSGKRQVSNSLSTVGRLSVDILPTVGQLHKKITM